MFKVISTFCLSLAFAALLASPAAAQVRNDGGLGNSSDTCADALLECVLDCTWLEDDGEFATCNQDCNEDFGICSRGDIASTGGTAGTAGQSTGTFEPPNGRNRHVVAVGLVGAAEVEGACRRVGGEFAQSPDTYGCINRLCTATGNCTFACFRGSCTAITPDRLTGPMTLIGILQNGDSVTGRGSGNTGGSLSGGSSGEAPAPDVIL